MHHSTYRHALLQISISASTDRSVGKSEGTEFLMQFWTMFMAPGGQLEPFTVLPEIKKTNKHWYYTVYNFLPFFSGVSANIAPCFNYCIVQSILFESPFFSEIIWLSLWKVGILEFFSAFIVKLKKIYISAWIWWIPADGLVSNKTHITVDYEVYVWEPCRVFTYHLNH